MSCRFGAAVVFFLLSTLLARAQFRTVTVENAVNNPVPTTIQNTPSVNVANTPTVSVSGTVNAAITGTPNVNATITGTPAVSVTNLPTGTAGPAATTGVLVKSLDNPAQQVFQQMLACTTVAAGPFGCTATLNVPAGKVLVLEYLQFTSAEFSGSSTVYYTLRTVASGNSLSFVFAPGTRIYANFPISEHQVQIYADPGSTVTFEGIENSNAGSISFDALLSGHLVNVP